MIKMEYALFAHWDLNLMLTKQDVFVLEIKNGYQLPSHVFNVKPMLHLLLTNSHVFATMDGLTIIMMVSVKHSVVPTNNLLTTNVFAKPVSSSMLEFVLFAHSAQPHLLT